MYLLSLIFNDAAELQVTLFLQLPNLICGSVFISCQHRILWRY